MDWHRRNTYRIVPGNRPDKFSSFLAASDVMVVDLADTVPMVDKAYARDEVGHWLAWNRQWNSELLSEGRLMVGINDVRSSFFEADLALLGTVRPLGILLNGIEAVDQVTSAVALFSVKNQSAPFMVPVIGSVTGVGAVEALAQCPFVGRLAFDIRKYRAERSDDVSTDEMNELIASVAAASKHYGLPSPLIGLPLAKGPACTAAFTALVHEPDLAELWRHG